MDGHRGCQTNKSWERVKHTKSTLKPHNCRVVSARSCKASLTCLPLPIQILNMAMGGKWMFIPLRKIWYNWLWNGLSHPHVKWNLHDIPMTNPPPVKFTIAYRDSKSRPLCAIKKLKLKDANAKTPDANAANLWFGQGPTGDKFSLPVLLLDGRSR